MKKTSISKQKIFYLLIIIEDDRLNLLPISTLYRIINSYTKEGKQELKIVQFILEYVNKHESTSSILLTTIEHNEKNLEYINQNINQYKNIIKYPEFQNILIEYLIQSNQKNKEKYDKKNAQESTEKPKMFRIPIEDFEKDMNTE